MRFWATGTRISNLSTVLTSPFAFDRFRFPCISLFHHTPGLLFHSQPPPDRASDNRPSARPVIFPVLPVCLLRRQVKHLDFIAPVGPAFCHCHRCQSFKCHFNLLFARRSCSFVFDSTSEAFTTIFASVESGCRTRSPRLT